MWMNIFNYQIFVFQDTQYWNLILTISELIKINRSLVINEFEKKIYYIICTS